MKSPYDNFDLSLIIIFYLFSNYFNNINYRYIKRNKRKEYYDKR